VPPAGIVRGRLCERGVVEAEGLVDDAVEVGESFEFFAQKFCRVGC